MSITYSVNKAGLIGGGVIGAGWAARFALNGIEVKYYDPADDADRKMTEVMANAERAYSQLLDVKRPAPGQLIRVDSLADAVKDADYVQESAPETLSLKQKVLADIDQHTPSDVLIGTSTSGLLPTAIQRDMNNKARMIVAHPFNPVYLLPLIELVAGEGTSDTAIQQAAPFFESIGMYPLHVRKEIDAHIADRLMEALWREALWLVKDGVATVEEIDDAIRYGCGLRWAQMGTFQIFNVAGGEAGMRHFMSQFGPALKWPWTKLMDTPELTDELVDTIANQVDDQAGELDFRELERIRDNNLVAIIRALKDQGWGAGKSLADYEARLSRLSE